jgi:hypothetical protein
VLLSRHQQERQDYIESLTVTTTARLNPEKVESEFVGLPPKLNELWSACKYGEPPGKEELWTLLLRTRSEQKQLAGAMTDRWQFWEEDWPGSLAAKYVKGVRLPLIPGKGWRQLHKAARQRKIWRSTAQCRDQRTNQILWDEFVGKLMPLGIVRPVSEEQVAHEDATLTKAEIPRVFINVRLVEKEGSEPRPCLAACTMNDGVADKKFKQSGSKEVQATMQKGDFCQNVDVKKAFNHMRWATGWSRIGSFFLINPTTGQVHMFEYPVSWFGQKRAPEFLDTAFRPIEHALHMVGCRVVRIVDDFLLLDQCAVTNRRHLKFLLLMSIRYGIGYGPDKAKIGLRQQDMDFGGWRWMLKTLQFYPRQRTIDKLVRLSKIQLQAHSSGQPVSVRTGPARLVGVIRATRDANRYAMFKTRSLLLGYIKTVTAGGWDSENHRYTQEAVDELTYWATSDPAEWAGITAHAELPDFVIDPDSSGTGGGFHLHEGPHNAELIQRWFYPEKDLKKHNNLLETRNAVDSLIATVLHLVSVDVVVKHKLFLIRPDNTTAVCAIDKIKSRNLACLMEALRLIEFCTLREIAVRAIHFPGAESLVADGESRAYATMADLCMEAHLFETINARWGPFTFSLFDANYLSHGLPFGAWKVDPQCTWRNSMIHDWNSLPQPANFYAFPPFHMVNRVLERVRHFNVDRICIVTPVWPARIWWPTMLEMLVDWPIVVPFDNQNFFLPGKRLSFRSKQRWWTRDWSMGIFPISANLLRQRNFRQLLSRTLLTDGALVPSLIMDPCGKSGSNSVNSTLIAQQRILATLKLRIS